MNGSGLATGLYPAVLTTTDFALGVALYNMGSIGFAFVLWFMGVAMLAGLVFSIWPLSGNFRLQMS